MSLADFQALVVHVRDSCIEQDSEMCVLLLCVLLKNSFDLSLDLGNMEAGTYLEILAR